MFNSSKSVVEGESRKVKIHHGSKDSVTHCVTCKEKHELYAVKW